MNRPSGDQKGNAGMALDRARGRAGLRGPVRDRPSGRHDATNANGYNRLLEGDDLPCARPREIAPGY